MHELLDVRLLLSCIGRLTSVSSCKTRVMGAVIAMHKQVLTLSHMLAVLGVQSRM